MTFDMLEKIIKENNIPSNVKLQSDSSWECGPTEMDGVYYNKKENTITFTQEGSVYDTEYYNTEGIQILNGKHKKCVDCAFRHFFTCTFHDSFLRISVDDISLCDNYKKK